VGLGVNEGINILLRAVRDQDPRVATAASSYSSSLPTSAIDFGDRSHQTDHDAILTEFQTAIDLALSPRPDRSYPDLHRDLLRATERLRADVIARVLEPHLNVYAASQPQINVEEKRNLAHWINDQLALLGLALKYPGTDNPSRL